MKDTVQRQADHEAVAGSIRPADNPEKDGADHTTDNCHPDEKIGPGNYGSNHA